MGQPGNAYLSRLGYSTFWNYNYNFSRNNSINVFNRSFLTKLFNYIFNYSYIDFYKYFYLPKWHNERNQRVSFRFFRKKEMFNKHVNLKSIYMYRNDANRRNGYTRVRVLSSSNWLFIVWFNIINTDMSRFFKKKLVKVRKFKNYYSGKKIKKSFLKYNGLKYLLNSKLNKIKLKLNLI